MLGREILMARFDERSPSRKLRAVQSFNAASSSSLVAKMAENLEFDLVGVLVIPFTLAQEGDIAFIAPGVGPLIVVRGESGVPALDRVRGEMLTDKRGAGFAMQFALDWC